MSNYLVFAVLGLGAGSLYAALAQGVVLAYRGAGVINLAHGALAMYVAYTYAGLRDGRLMIPPLPNPLALVEGVAGWFGSDLRLPRFPPFITLSGPLGTWTALVASLAVAVVLGLAIHVLVFRPLRAAPALAKTVASVGLLLAIQATVILRFGTENITVPRILPSSTSTIAGRAVPNDRFAFLAIVLVLMLLLNVTFRYTRLGIATRAASENERGALLLGLSPDRLAAANWVTSTLVAGLAGILLASLAGLNPTDLVLYVIPALGAALLARFDSFTLATLVAVLIGVAESIATLLQSTYSWFPQAGAPQGIPFLVIILGMVLRGRGLPERGSLLRVRLPSSPEPRHVPAWSAGLTAVTVLGLVFLPFDLRGALLNSMVAVVLALSFVVVVGFAGQISLMQMALAGVAALALTRLATGLHVPFPLAPLLAVLVAVAVGVLAGLPSLRVRGVQLAVLTLGAGYAFEHMVLDNTSLLRLSDVSGVPAPSLFGASFSVNGSFPIGSAGSPNATFGFFVLAVVLLCAWGVVKLRQSSLGRQFLAVRSNERAAASLGISVPRVKLIAFGIGALLAGVAGVLTAYQFQGVSATPYVAIASVTALISAYLGGISMISGAVFAGLLANGGVFARLLERLAHMGKYEPLVLSVSLILTVAMNPEGIAGVAKDTAATLRALVARARGPLTRPREGLAPGGVLVETSRL